MNTPNQLQQDPNTTFEKEYSDLMSGYTSATQLSPSMPQWNSPKDYIQKFSLLQDSHLSITSTDTIVCLP